MEDEVELGTISLVYERHDKRVEMYVTEEDPWPTQLRTYFEFLRAIGFFIDASAEEEGIQAAWEQHHKSIEERK